MTDIEHDDYCPDKGDRRCDCDWEARVRADERAAVLADLRAKADECSTVGEVLALIEEVERA